MAQPKKTKWSRKGKFRRRSKLVPLSEVVRKAHPKPGEVDFSRILAWWCTTLPPRIAARSRPARLANRVLWVHTVSTTWAQELSFMTEELLTRLNQSGLGVTISSIRFRTGRLPPEPRRKAAPREAPTLREVELPETIGRALAAIGDDGVRDVVLHAALTSLAATKP